MGYHNPQRACPDNDIATYWNNVIHSSKHRSTRTNVRWRYLDLNVKFTGELQRVQR